MFDKIKNWFKPEPVKAPETKEKADKKPKKPICMRAAKCFITSHA